MAHGKPICAVCGGTVGVEEHHLYLRADGCPDDLTIWLCYTHHGAAHGLKRRINICLATKAALVAAKARGVKLGGYRGGPVVDGRLGGAARRSKADRFAAGLSLNAMAAELTQRGILTSQGGTAWTATAVRRVLARTA